MARFLAGFLVVGFAAWVLMPVANAQQETTKKLQDLVAKFPTPAQRDGKLADVDKKATDAAISEFLQEPTTSMVGLVNLLSTKGGDVQVRHAIHAVVMRVGSKKNAKLRRVTAKALASTLNGDRAKPIQRFVVQQLQLVGTAEETGALGKLLLDPELAGPAAQALLSIKTDAATQFRMALPKASGKQRALIVHGLGALKDKKAATMLRAVLDDRDRDTRLTAAWALANLADANSAERLIQLADAAKGYERAKATDSCFLLAENLIASGNPTVARQIYSHLQQSRSSAAERYVRETAARGLAKVKK
ncbi:MAG: HEAT repeat domain-containing protein [Gemmataceae bacterium]